MEGGKRAYFSKVNTVEFFEIIIIADVTGRKHDNDIKMAFIIILLKNINFFQSQKFVSF